MELTMKPRESHDPVTGPPPTRGPLTDLVDEKLNKSVADQIAEALDQREEPARSGASDYARGTTEHEDEPEA